MTHSEAFIYGDKQPIEDIGNGMKRQLMGYNDQIMMAKIWFDDNAIGYVHAHMHSQVTYIESGEFEVQVGEEKQLLKAGDCFFMLPHADHGAVCKKAGILIDVFSPLREDFL